MSRALIVRHGLTDRARAIGLIQKAPTGSRVEVKGARRTLPQSARLWAMLTDVAAQATHHGLRYTLDQWKVIFLHALGREVQFKRGRKRKIRHDKRRYRERWRIEATFNRLKDFRRIATRYDKLARNYASAVALAAVIAFWC